MALSPQLLITFINFLINLVEGLLGLRVVLKLFGAKTAAPFVTWVYESSEPLLKPFLGMFPSPNLTGGLVIEFSSLFALMVYSFIGYLAIETITNLMKRSK